VQPMSLENNKHMGITVEWIKEMRETSGVLFHWPDATNLVRCLTPPHIICYSPRRLITCLS
ncbi:hypothetical protein, partial [Petrachloros mirabilis]